MTNPLPVQKRRERWLPPHLVSAFLSGHSALGLAVSALIYLVCLSGTVVVFAQELERWEQPTGPLVTDVAPGVIDRGLQELLTKANGKAPSAISVALPTPATPRLVLIGGSVEDGRGRWFADVKGSPVTRVSHRATDFLVALHANLHLPRIAGLAVVGLIGIALLALLISGVLAHPRIFREAFTLRWGGSRRLQEADLHNRLGTWGLPFHLMVTLTGAVLGAFLLMFGGMASTAYKGNFRQALTEIVGPLEAHADPATTAMPAMDPIIAIVRSREPSARIQAVEVQHPGTRGQTITVLFEEPGRLSHDQRYVFDGSGRVTYSTKTRPRPIGARALLSLPPLHFGWFGGLGTKLAYGLLGLSLCMVTSSGVSIWLARRRDKGRPAPALERLWTATVWGQAAAFASSGLVSIAWTNESAAGVGWSVSTAICYLAACHTRRDAVSLQTPLQLCVGGLIVLLGIVHAARWMGQSVDGAAWVIDAVLVAGGIGIVAGARLHGRGYSHRSAAYTSPDRKVGGGHIVSSALPEPRSALSSAVGANWPDQSGRPER